MAIDVLFFDELSSTNLQAAEELRNGRKPPFAVCAMRQSGGRGRRGRSWHSPDGGLYLTVVLPPPSLDISLFGNIPLWVGTRVSAWITGRLGFQIALKWPNDLMFDGRKLGGILVESGIEGNKPGSVTIGIGINTNVTPDIEPIEKDHVFAVSLAEIVGAKQDPKSLATSLAQDLSAQWLKTDLRASSQAFLEQCSYATRLWRSDSRYFYAESIGNDGSLILKSLVNPDDFHKLNSADHKFLAGTRTNPMPVALADVGNTATKIRIFKSYWTDDVLAEARALHDGDLRSELARMAALVPCKGWPLIIASVAPVRSATLFALAEEAGFSPIALVKRAVLRRGTSYPIQDLGIDRLAAIEGWLALRSERPAVIVSCGTAITVDAIEANGTHVGGVIAPGFSLTARALHENTGLLPLIEHKEIADAADLGTSTRSAIAAGIKGQVLGLVERIAAKLSKSSPQIILCGGDAAILKDEISGAVLDDDLVFRGLRAMAGGGLLTTENWPLPL